MPNIAFVNDQFMNLSEAKVSIDDRGFQFGDGIYEVIRSYNGQIFCLDNHLARLAESAKSIKLDINFPITKWRDLVISAFRKSSFDNARIYIQITRGVAERSHIFPEKAASTKIITVRELKPQPIADYEEGVKVITVPDIRWGRCDIKSLNLLPNILAKQEAKELGAYEAIFTKDQFISEGATSNFFAVINGILTTHPKGTSILAGITRDIVINLAKEHSIGVAERPISMKEIKSMEEIIIAGTTIEVIPVIKINDLIIGNGQPGKVYTILRNAFAEFVKK